MAQLTVLVGVVSADISTLAKELPNAWRDAATGIRYFAVQTNCRSDTGWKWVDVNIVEGHNNNTNPIGVTITKRGSVTQVLTSRHGKFAQAEFINQMFQAKDYWPEFLPLRVWKDAKDYDGIGDKLMIMRPENGARGIGQLVYNPVYTTLAMLTKAMYHIDRAPDTSCSPSVKPDDVVEASKSSISEEQFSFDMRNKFLREAFAALPGNPQWYSESDRRKGEGYQILKEDSFIQEYVPNIEAEYRIIIGGNNTPVYALKRNRKDYWQVGNVPLAAACGEDVGPEKSFDDLHAAGIPHYVIQGFNKLCQEYDFSLFSFDLFITNEGKWGILEFCNEFGQCSVPDGLVNREIKKFIERVTAG